MDVAVALKRSQWHRAPGAGFPGGERSGRGTAWVMRDSLLDSTRKDSRPCFPVVPTWQARASGPPEQTSGHRGWLCFRGPGPWRAAFHTPKCSQEEKAALAPPFLSKGSPHMIYNEESCLAACLWLLFCVPKQVCSKRNSLELT